MSAISIEPASLTIPAEVVKIHDIANRYREEVSRHNEAILALMAEESSARNAGGDRFGTAISGQIETYKTIERFRDMLVRQAESALAPAGAKLSIQLHVAARGKPEATVDGFDACKLWATLAEYYSGGAAAASAYGELGARLVRHFRELYSRSRGEEVKTVGGRVILSTSAFIDDFPGDRYSYRSIEDLQKIGHDFAALLIWAGLGDSIAPMRVRAAFSSAFAWDARFTGERFVACDHILVVPFKSKVEFRITPELADALKLFLSEFGPADEE
jgi:hypothetical protein